MYISLYQENGIVESTAKKSDEYLNDSPRKYPVKQVR